MPTPRKNRLEENSCSVWTRRVSWVGSCSSSLMTPLPAWTRVVTARIEDTTSSDSYPPLTSGMKILVTLLFLSRMHDVSLISLGENTPRPKREPYLF